jgi:signal transduction histidine kinase
MSEQSHFGPADTPVPHSGASRMPLTNRSSSKDQSLVVASVAISAIALAGFVGRILRIPFLFTFGVGGAPMSMNTALCFLLVGGGLWFRVTGRPRWARGSALALLAISTVLLAQAVFRRDFGLSYLRWHSLQITHDIYAGRLAPSASIALFLAALALLFIGHKRCPPVILAFFAAGILLIGLLPQLSRLIDIGAVWYWASFHGVAMPSSIGFLVLGLGLLCWLAANYGEVGLSSALIAAAAAVAGAVATETTVGITELHTANTWVAQELKIELNLEHLIGALSRMDSSVRSYAATGDEEFARRMSGHRAEVMGQYQSLAQVVANDPGQEQEMRKLQPFIDRKLAVAAAIADARSRGGLSAAARLIEQNSETERRELDAVVGDLREEENALLTTREQTTRHAEGNTKAIRIVGALVSLVFLGLAIGLARRASRLQDASSRALLQLQTQLIERNAALEVETRRAQEANRLKSVFLANMSHELRTPLNGILGFTQLLLDPRTGPLNTEQQECLNDVQSSGRHLLQLINNLLDLAKIEAGRMELDLDVFSVGESINEVSRVLSPLLAAKKISYSSEVELPDDTVTLDPGKFRQILYNLISNAIKFTDENGRVGVKVRPIDADRFSLCVSDSGIGIAPENLKLLFVDFQQLDSGTNRRQQGTGLGLALTKRIVELHGGSIGAESELGVGTVFTAILPRMTKVGAPAAQT